MKTGWIGIGRVLRARGIRGELIAELDSSDPRRAEKLGKVLLEKGGESRFFHVESTWQHNGRPILKLAGIDSMTAAEELAGSELLVEESEQLRPAEGEYSHAELAGCEVWSGPDRVGVVRGVEEYGGPPLLQVDAEDGREILIPFTRSICKVIDVAEKIIRVEAPEGLLDLK